MRARGWSVATSWAVVVLWTVVSVGVSIAALTALSLPTWFLRTDRPLVSFGVWWWSGIDLMIYTHHPQHGFDQTHRYVDFPHVTDELHRVTRSVSDPSPQHIVLQENYSEAMPHPTLSLPIGSSTIQTEHQNDNFFSERWSISGGASVWVIVGALYGGAAVVLGTTGLGGPLLLPLLRAKARSGVTRLLSNMQAAAGN